MLWDKCSLLQLYNLHAISTFFHIKILKVNLHRPPFWNRICRYTVRIPWVTVRISFTDQKADLWAKRCWSKVDCYIFCLRYKGYILTNILAEWRSSNKGLVLKNLSQLKPNLTWLERWEIMVSFLPCYTLKCVKAWLFIIRRPPAKNWIWCNFFCTKGLLVLIYWGLKGIQLFDNMRVVYSVTWHSLINDVTMRVFGNGECLDWEFLQYFWFNLFRITVKL